MEAETKKSSSCNGKGLNRKQILEKKKRVDEIIKAAVAVKDHLSSFASFRHYSQNGLSVYLESGKGDKLTSNTKQYIQHLLKVNMEMPYGSEWPAEEKVKRKEMVAPQAHYIFVHEAPKADDNQISESGVKETASSNCAFGGLVGFVHYRFFVEEEVPILYLYELQLEPRIHGKGLGKFLMQLVELIARKNELGAVLLTVQKANLTAMNFYIKMRYTISAISPSKVDQSLGLQSSYEILCKAFHDEATAIFG